MNTELEIREATFQPGISLVAASGIVEFIAHHGARPDRILTGAGLADDAFHNPRNRIPLATYCSIFEHSARATGVETFGLRFGSTRSIEVLGPLGEVALNAPTLGAALNAVSRLFPALQEQSSLKLRRSDTVARLEYQINDGRIVHRRHDAELTIGVLLELFRKILGPCWTPECIEFEHAALAGKIAVETLAQAPVEFSASTNSVVFPAALLTTQIPGADIARASILESQLGRLAASAQPDDFVGRVLNEIRMSFDKSEATLTAVARRMGMSEASLYRSLRRRHVEFSDLVRGLRRELAYAWLRDSEMPLTEISFLLGYSELSAFSRAFRSWAGISPMNFRNRSRLEAQ